MAFIFTMRSTPVHGHRRNPSATVSLPAIEEDNASFITSTTAAPPVPPRALNRPTRYMNGFGTGNAQGWMDTDPPSYDDIKSAKGSNGEKLAELKRGWVENRHISKRGGWKKLFLVLLLIVILAVSLGAGLGIGLKKRNSATSNSANAAASDASSSIASGGASGDVQTPPSTLDTPPNATFPIGSYTFNTYLSTVAANCTSNPATWMCYPHSTYAQSPSSSATTFDWIIRNASSTSNNLTISSTPNPFSILFDSVPLQLLKQGQQDEHYFFQLSMSKQTKPTTQLGEQNVASTCTFNDTTLQAYLYTKMQKTYPKNEQDEDGGSGGFTPWPGAIKIEQVVGASPASPKCVDNSGNSLGDFGVEDGTQLCDCLWLNTGT